ncbi:MAG: hypothetical protein WD009_00265 [Phycisphaeraceae bacterium]
MLRHCDKLALLLACLLLVAIALPACRSAEERERDRWAEMERGAFRERSEVLSSAFDDILDDYLARQNHADAADREQVRTAMLDAVPGLLLTTEAIEEAFADGEFPNAANQRRVDRTLNQMRILDARLPGFTQMLVDRHHRGELRDAELEILRRLLEHHMDGIGDRLWPS